MQAKRALLLVVVIAALGALVYWVARPSALDAIADGGGAPEELDAAHERESLANEAPATPDAKPAPTSSDVRATDAPEPPDPTEHGASTRATIRGRVVGADGLPVIG